MDTDLQQIKEYRDILYTTIESLNKELSYSESQSDYKNALTISKLINKLRMTYIKRLEIELKI